jgi:hypothetical protein
LQLKQAEPDLAQIDYPGVDPEILAKKMARGSFDTFGAVASLLADHPEELDAEGRALLAAGQDITIAQGVRMIEIGYDLLTRLSSSQAAQVASGEEQLRRILQLIAGATEEGA